MAKIEIDEDECIGCALCAEICNKTFEMDETKAKVKKSKVDKVTSAHKEAADSCPVSAIKISD